MKTIRIAVVGGGLAGLTTAHLIRKMNRDFGDSVQIEVEVFESTNRLGSQMPSRRHFAIADTDHEILSLAREMNVNLVPLPDISKPESPLSELMMAMVSEILHLKSKGIIENPEDWAEKEHDLLELLDSMSIVDFFVKKGKMADEVRTALSSTLLSDYAEDLDDLSALDALRFMSQYIRSKRLYKMEKGIGALSQVLVDGLNADKQRVFTDSTLLSVELVDEKWTISFAKEEPQHYDFVVMSLPDQYKQQSDSIYFKPGQRCLIGSMHMPDNGLFFAEEFVTEEAPASMNSAVKSAHQVVYHSVLPALHEFLPVEEDEFMPKVEKAVFTSVNDPCLETILT